jgi:hypothetical protein
MWTKYLIFLLPFILFACFKKTINPKKEAFYCKVNGKEFVPEVDKSPIGGIGSSPLKISWDGVNGWYYISALNRPQYVSIFIKLPSNQPISVGEYILGNDLKGSKGYYTFDYSAPVSEYLISSTGKVTITKVEGVKIWGTFEFRVKDNKQNIEYIISDGQLNELSN